MDQEKFDVDALNFPELTTETKGNDQAVTDSPKVESEPIVPAVETKPEPEIETKVEVKSTEVTPTDPVPTEIKISDPPSQYEGESEIQFNLRKQIFDAGQAKAQANTLEEKSELASHIKGLRKELAVNHKSSEAVQAPEKIEANESQTQGQSEEELAKIALKNLGYLSKDEVEQIIRENIANQSRQDEHLSATREFYSTHKDIASNHAQKEVLEKFVVEKFNITPQSTKQDLLVAMDMARSYLFPKVDNRSAKANESAAKRDILNVSSNTQSVPTSSKVDEKLQAGLKEVGLTDKEMGWD